MVDYAATDKERAEIQEAVKYHYRRLENEKDEIRQNEAFINGIGKSYNMTIGLYREFEQRNIKYIAELGVFMGLLTRIKEASKDGKTVQYSEYFMRLSGAQMEELYAEIEYYRQTIKELQGLSG